MKKLMGPFCSLVFLAVPAHAAVVDTVACTISLKDSGSGNETQNSAVFEIARRPLSASPSPDVRLYAGEFQSALMSRQGDFEVSINYRLASKHAMKELAGGTWDARHTACAELQYSVCRGKGSCAAMSLGCTNAEDPFDPRIGWSKVEMINGIPQFNPLQLPANLHGKVIYGHDEVAEYTLQCAYKGTLD